MLIQCIYKHTNDVPADRLFEINIALKPREFDLIINKHYQVYGLILHEGCIWYYICDESYSYYPVWYPSFLFNIVDGRLSRYWIYSLKKDINQMKYNTIIGYPEWANNFYEYYDRLTDGCEKEVKIFKKYKYSMDLEFPNPSIFNKATKLDNKWLMCTFCIDAWETTSQDGMVICPNCQRMLHNPFYEDKPVGLEFEPLD